MHNVTKYWKESNLKAQSHVEISNESLFAPMVFPEMVNIFYEVDLKDTEEMNLYISKSTNKRTKLPELHNMANSITRK